MTEPIDIPLDDFVAAELGDPWADDGISNWDDYPEGTEVIAYTTPDKPRDWCGTPVPGGPDDPRGPLAMLRDDGVGAFKQAMAGLGQGGAAAHAFLDARGDSGPSVGCMPAFDDSLVTPDLLDSLLATGLAA